MSTSISNSPTITRSARLVSISLAPVPRHPRGCTILGNGRRSPSAAYGAVRPSSSESTFLQNSMMPLFIDDAPLAAVKELFAEITRRIVPAAPLLVYLRPSDVAAAIRRVHAERGEPWSSRNYAFVSACSWARRRGFIGERAVVELYRAWEQLVDEVLPTVESIVVTDPKRDWTGTL